MPRLHVDEKKTEHLFKTEVITKIRKSSTKDEPSIETQRQQSIAKNFKLKLTRLHDSIPVKQLDLDHLSHTESIQKFTQERKIKR